MQLLKKIITEIIVLIIIKKEKKKLLRNFLRNRSFFAELLSLASFLINQRSGDVLYIEPSDAHGEIVPGYIKLFVDMGMKVDVVIDSSVFKMKSLHFFKSTKYKIYVTNFYFLKYILNSKRAQMYKIVFIATNEIYQYYNKLFCNIFFNFALTNIEKLLLVEHDLKNLERYNSSLELYQKGRVAVLKNFKQDALLKEIVPDYFGDFSHQSEDNKEVVFIVVGGLSSNRRNPELIVHGVNFLFRHGFESFRIVIVGDGKLPYLPKKCAEKIFMKGRLEFPEMYQEIRNSDFFLPLFDSNFDAHQKYKTSVCSGSIQLIFGFSIPAVLNRDFAKIYGLDCDSSVLYEDNEIGLGMMKAIQIDEKFRHQMSINLESKRFERYANSLSNLQKCI